METRHCSVIIIKATILSNRCCYAIGNAFYVAAAQIDVAAVGVVCMNIII